MSRDITSALAEALAKEIVQPFYAIDLFFDSPNDTYLWTGLGELSYAENTYYGIGSFLGVDIVKETSDISAVGAEITLSGVDSSITSLALSEPYQGRACNIYFGLKLDGSLLKEDGLLLFQEDGFSSLNLELDGEAATAKIFSGYMDQMDILEGPETSTISLKAENRLIDLERVRPIRFTSAYQKSLYPGDLGLDFVETLQDKQLTWGKSTSEKKDKGLSSFF